MKNDKSLITLSVIVISIGSATSLEICLESILGNKILDSIEIIALISGSDESFLNLKKKFSATHFIEFQEKLTIPQLIAQGISKSRGAIIAVIDSSCLAAKDWKNSILRAHHSAATVIGGAVEPITQMKPLDRAAYFCEYGKFMLPLESEVANAIPGNNFSFKREALDIGSEFTAPQFWKTFWCQQLQNAGHQLILNPEILVRSGKRYLLLSFLKRRFHHGRCFAAMRIRPETIFKRLFFLGGTAFLPFILLYRIIPGILKKKRLIKEFISAFPFILLAIISWSFGEFYGYLAGSGKSCDYIEV